MRQPHFCNFCPFCKICSLIKGHMFVLTGFCFFLFFCIHALTDKQICMFCTLSNNRNRSGIRTIGKLNSFSLRSKHHVRCQHTISILDDLSFLQTAPEFLRNLLSAGTLHVKSALTFDFQGISIAGYIMIYPKGMNTISIHLKILLFFCYFMIFNRKWQFRCNGAQRIYHTFQSSWSDHMHRFGTICVSKSQ